MTPQPNFILLYVESPKASETFYSALLGRPPVESSPNFVLFVADSGLRLGMWARREVEPRPSAPAGGGEIVIPVEEKRAVDSTYASWVHRATTDRFGFRPHVCGARSGRPSPARVRARRLRPQTSRRRVSFMRGARRLSQARMRS